MNYGDIEGMDLDTLLEVFGEDGPYDQAAMTAFHSEGCESFTSTIISSLSAAFGLTPLNPTPSTSTPSNPSTKTTC